MTRSSNSRLCRQTETCSCSHSGQNNLGTRLFFAGRACRKMDVGEQVREGIYKGKLNGEGGGGNCCEDNCGEASRVSLLRHVVDKWQGQCFVVEVNVSRGESRSRG